MAQVSDIPVDPDDDEPPAPWAVGDMVRADDTVGFFVVGERRFDSYTGPARITAIEYDGYFMCLWSECRKYMTWVKPEEFAHLTRC